MKKRFKAFLVLLLVIATVFSTTIPAFAMVSSSQPLTNQEVQPRSILGYASHNHSGNSTTGKFTITISSIPAFNITMNQFSFQSSGFDSDALINFNIYNSSGVSSGTRSVVGNSYSLKNKALGFSLKSGATYTVSYEVIKSNGNSDSGTLEVWLF